MRDIINTSSSFILLWKYNTSIYALTGGYGYARIKDHVIEDFGLEIALRMIEDLSGLGQRSMKGTTRQIYRAVSGYDPTFDRENYTRVLNAIEGKATFSGKKFRITGRACLSLRTVKDIHKLPEVFQEIEEISARAEKWHFPKSYRKVKDRHLIQELDSDMLRYVQDFWAGRSDRERLYLEFKDPFVQFRCATFELSYRGLKVEIEDFDLDILRRKMFEEGINAISDIGTLKSIRIAGYNEDQHKEFSDETFLDLLVCEVGKDRKSYIKFGKDWLQILDEIQRFIDGELKKIPLDRSLLPEWDKTALPEEYDYNKHVAAARGWTCCDRDLVHLEGKSKIELCDILNQNMNLFFHVKETWGSKSAYLFTQGVTAAELFRNSEEFRIKCEEKWPGLDDAAAGKCQIIFGIASENSTRPDFPLNMTYFAKLNLYIAVTALKQLDFSVTLAPINLVRR